MASSYLAVLACLTLGGCIEVLSAQSVEPSDAWLMQNYRFAGPPPPECAAPADPVISELRQIQNTLLSIMRKADFSEDWEGALAAADQATAVSQLIGAITEHVQSMPAASRSETRPASSGPLYVIAFKDHTVAAATAYWADGLMFHYLTPQGAHVQVRLDLVDRSLTIRLNRMNNLVMNLPE
jgi:hypothetical protein